MFHQHSNRTSKESLWVFSLLESNLDLWDDNCCFTNRLLKYLVPNPLKNLHDLACIRAFLRVLHSSFTAIHWYVTTGFSTNSSRKYLWFDVPTTFGYRYYPFKYVSLHTSSQHFFLNTTLSFSKIYNTSSGPTKRKINFPSGCHLSIYNHRQDIWKRIEKSSKIGQSKKSLISTFAVFLTFIAKV